MDNPPLNQEMRCSIISNANGDIVILHEQPLTSEIQWVQFDVKNLCLSLIHEDGSQQKLGIEIKEKMAKNLENGTEVQLVLLQDKEFKNVYKTTIVIQDY